MKLLKLAEIQTTANRQTCQSHTHLNQKFHSIFISYLKVKRPHAFHKCPIIRNSLIKSPLLNLPSTLLIRNTPMKLPLTIALTIAFLTSWGQTDSDSLKVAAPDSLAGLVLPDSLSLVPMDSTLFMMTHAQDSFINVSDTLSHYFYITTCKDIENRKGILYYYIEGVAIPFCGQCVETNDDRGVLVLYSKEVYSLPEIIKSDNTVKAAHMYKDGLRHGISEYFDKKGKRTKMETYENGKLVTDDW